jgi:phosphatidylinositol alpha-1,6-mannosyltransferase
MTHLLVTNDFPPKVGGIQTYLGELWRRLPAPGTHVLTTPHRDAPGWDRAQPFDVRRARSPWLVPTPGVARSIRQAAADVGASLVVLDPALPLGLVGPSLGLPYAVVLHGAEVTVPARLPGSRELLARVLAGATGIVAAGRYPAAEARRLLGARTGDVLEVPPGVDVERFRPLDADARAGVRRRFGIADGAPFVFCASRLVPRKGIDVLIEAATHLLPHRPMLTLVVAGGGRDASRLRVLARRHAVPVRFLGRVAESDLVQLYAAADVFALPCRDRWGGLEQEGFGIVFLEAAACAVPQVAGASGGADEAVEDGVTGLVVRRPHDPAAVAAALASLLDDPDRRARMGQAARRRAVAQFSWDTLAARLGNGLRTWESAAATTGSCP